MSDALDTPSSDPAPSRSVQPTWSVAPCWTWFADDTPVADRPESGDTHPLRVAADKALAGDLSAWKASVAASSNVIIQGAVSPALISHLSLEGAHPPSLQDGVLRMETRGGTSDRALTVFRTAPSAHGALYWMRLHVDAAAEDQCQLRLIHAEGYEEEILRIKARSVIVARNQELFTPFIRTDRLVCIVADGAFLHLYIDGVLCFRRARSRSDCPTGFILDMNVSAASGSLDIHSLGLASLDKPFSGLGLPDDAPADQVPAQLATALIETGRSSDFGKVCYAVADLPLRCHAEALGEATAALKDSHEISRKWVVDPLLAALPSDQAEHERSRIDTVLGDPMVSVRDAGVKFLSNPADARSLWSMMSRRRDHRHMLQVFRNISFDLYAGDTLGIIGHNGAGKTTLLRTIAGVIGLSHGSILIRGDSVLLRPGAGMRDDLTGRQNILLGSVFMGLSMAEAQMIMDDVIEFSELEDAIDRPYKYYSDGMRSRLIFSIATAMPPDILMLDELLGAGDLAFQQKANDRLSSFIDRAKVVIVVEHGLSFVATKCNKALYIGNNQRVFYGDPQIAIAQYMSERESEDRQLPYGDPPYFRPQ